METITVKYLTMKQVLSYKDGQRFKFTKRKLNEIMHNALLAGYLFVAKKVDEKIIHTTILQQYNITNFVILSLRAYNYNN